VDKRNGAVSGGEVEGLGQRDRGQVGGGGDDVVAGDDGLDGGGRVERHADRIEPFGDPAHLLTERAPHHRHAAVA